MSFTSRLAALLRSATRSPAVRRAARDLGEAALKAATEDHADASSGTGTAPGRTASTTGRKNAKKAPSRTSSATAPAPAKPAPTPASSTRSEQASASADATVLADRSGSAPLAITYAPHADDVADPGEIVWAWVHYEEDMLQGKDRPVLIIAEEPAAAGGADGTGAVLVALMLTSRDRTPSGGTATDEHGATWVDIGSGDWDRQGRESEVRADRLLRLSPGGVRREGARLDADRFARVAAEVRRTHGWA
ncbi:type II toxin-antitoxin system PemK/MazF family toxin [Brachybacterium sp. DNPG3]